MSGFAIPLLTLLMALLSAGFAWISENETQLIYSAALTLLFCMITTSALVFSLRVNSTTPKNQAKRRIEREREFLPVDDIGTLKLFNERAELPSAQALENLHDNTNDEILNEVSSFLERQTLQK